MRLNSFGNDATEFNESIDIISLLIYRYSIRAMPSAEGRKMSEFKTADVLQITNDPEFILDSQFEVDCGAYAKQFAGYLKNVIVRPSLSLGVDGKPLRDIEGKIRYRRGSNPLPAGEDDFGSNRVFQIPKGFRFDGASIPDFAAFLGKLVMNFDYTQGDPRLHTASVAHDWLIVLTSVRSIRRTIYSFTCCWRATYPLAMLGPCGKQSCLTAIHIGAAIGKKSRRI